MAKIALSISLALATTLLLFCVMIAMVTRPSAWFLPVSSSSSSYSFRSSSQSLSPSAQLQPAAVTFNSFDTLTADSLIGSTPYSTWVNFPPFVPDLLPGGPTGPTHSGQFLRLALGTGITGTNHNSIAFDQTALATPDWIVADFDLRMTPRTGRADGMGFALLDPAHYGTSGPQPPTAVAEEPNFWGSLGIGFDIYRSGVAGENLELNDNHVSVHFDGVAVGEFDARNLLDLAGSEWIHARVLVQPGTDGTHASVFLNQCDRSATAVVDSVVVPGLAPYPGRAFFAARSGGLTADQDLDNVRVNFLTASQNVISFERGCHQVMETDGEVLVTVTRLGVAMERTVLEFTTEDDTAVAGVDYAAMAGTLIFEAGQLTQTVRVPVFDNDEVGERAFRLRLLDPASRAVVLGGPSVARVEIGDDESARQVGRWSNVIPSHVVPVHMHLLPTGQVMYWDRHDGEKVWDGAPRLFDPLTEMITATATVTYDIFCAGHSFLADGRLLVTGGHYFTDTLGEDKASIYDPFDDTWTRLPDMNAGRWYPSNVTLSSGDVLVLAGTTFTDTGAFQPDGLNRLPQIWEVDEARWRNLTGAEYRYEGDHYPDYADYYPFLYSLETDRVFNAGPQAVARLLDTRGIGAWTDVATSTLPYRDYGTSVMYDEGKILIVGGNERANPPFTDPVPSNSAEVIDLNAETPTWRTLDAPMQYGRRHHNATLLPDGTVLVTGGSSAPGFNTESGAVLPAELWDPHTETWTELAPVSRYRGYHSTALLLPDARVLVGGGGHPDPAGGAQFNFEIFSPPYLFNGPRPTITSAPQQVAYGQPFTVQTPDAHDISAVTWIALSAVTHAYNQGQRINHLSFTTVEQSADQLRVDAPASADLAPPGYHMLFILNEKSVPSQARFVRVVEPLDADDVVEQLYLPLTVGP